MSKTLIDGTSYDIAGGVLNMYGTAYDIKQGKTKVNGTGYGIYLGERKKAFYWGPNYGVVDGEWMLRLSNTLKNLSPSEIEETFELGMSKFLRIPISDLGNGFIDKAMKFRIIGINHDCPNSLTMDSAYVFSAKSPNVYFLGNAQWQNSNVRQICQQLYEIFPGKEAILELTKGTNLLATKPSIGQTKDKIWIPSRWELGYSKYTYVGPIQQGVPDMGDMDHLAPEYTIGENAVQAPYPYYGSNNHYYTSKYMANINTTDEELLEQYSAITSHYTPYWTRSRTNASLYPGPYDVYAVPGEVVPGDGVPHGGILNADSYILESNGDTIPPRSSFLSPCFTIG